MAPLLTRLRSGRPTRSPWVGCDRLSAGVVGNRECLEIVSAGDFPPQLSGFIRQIGLPGPRGGLVHLERHVSRKVFSSNAVINGFVFMRWKKKQPSLFSEQITDLHTFLSGTPHPPEQIFQIPLLGKQMLRRASRTESPDWNQEGE